jgi:hypothetical protein
LSLVDNTGTSFYKDTKAKHNDAFVSVERVGGAAGTRTLYLFNAIEALSRMSYSPSLIQYTLFISVG